MPPEAPPAPQPLWACPGGGHGERLAARAASPAAPSVAIRPCGSSGQAGPGLLLPPTGEAGGGGGERTAGCTVSLQCPRRSCVPVRSDRPQVFQTEDALNKSPP